MASVPVWAARPPLRPCRRPLARTGARRLRRRPRGALLAGALLAHCAAVGHAGTPNAWSTVALSGDVPGGLSGHGTAEVGGLVTARVCVWGG